MSGKSNRSRQSQAKRRATARRPANKASAKSAARRRRERRSLYTRLVAGAVVLLIGGVVLYSAASPGNTTRSVVETLEVGGFCKYDSRFDGDAGNQGDHVQNPTYKLDPPAGGPHFPTPAEAGFYDVENVPTDGELVHAMEHGFVVLWYRPDLGPDDQSELESLSDRFGRELIVAPRPSLDGEVVVTAWHKRLLCTELDATKVARFTEAFKDQGTEKGFL